VNFLLHHHFAALELSDAPHPDLVAIGAMLPDLFRMARPRRHPRKMEAPASALSDEHRALIRGCEHHAEIDKWFHSSEAFVRGERDLRHAFLLPDSPKLVLFAHAAWEMCLDGAWLRQATYEERARLRATSKAGPFTQAVAYHEGVTAGLDDASLASFDGRMRRILAAFADETIYLDYLDARGIARRLAGIRAAFGLGVPAAETLDAWARALEPFVERADGALSDLVAERDAS
jgi:hypothetical protein